MENELFDAATDDDIDALSVIIRNDKSILRKFVAGCFNWNPLLVAASQGHGQFVGELLSLNLELAQALDSQNRTALHLAAGKGHVEVVKLLLISLGSDICLSRDQNGRFPLHVAAINGKIEVVEELLRANMDVARARLEKDETILHMCVKHQKFEVLKLLLATVKDKEFVNAKDDRGNTVLHIAVYKKQFQVITYVLDNSLIEVNAKNLNGQTALDILHMLGPTAEEAEQGELDAIEEILLRVFGKSGAEVTSYNWQEKRDILMLVSSVIGATSFQAAMSPPGGFWQDTSDGHKAGEAVLATTSPQLYSSIISCNYLTFFISMMSMLLFSWDPPFLKRYFLKYILLYSSLTIILMTFTYVISVSAITPGNNFLYHEYSHGFRKKTALSTLKTNNFIVVSFLVTVVPIYILLLVYMFYWVVFQQIKKEHNYQLLAKIRCASPDSSQVQGAMQINTE